MHKNFLNLEEKFSNENDSKIVILPVPFDKTVSYISGTAKGPQAIIDSSAYLELYDIETDSEIYKNGIYTDNEKKYDSSEEMIKKLPEIISSYLKKDKFVVTLGGEHSISLSPIKAHAEHFQKISVLHFDAHADLAPALNRDKYSHGSVMARVRELPSFTNNTSNIVSIGIRSMSKEEKKYINPSNVFYAHELDDNTWMEKALNLLSDNVYITFDIDAFDPSLVPATGTPEPGGMQWNQTMQFLKTVAMKKRIIGFDLMELCPIKGMVSSDFVAAKFIYKLLSYIFYKG